MAIQPTQPGSIPTPANKPMAPPAVPIAVGKAGTPPLTPGVIPPPAQKANLKLPPGAQVVEGQPLEDQEMLPPIGFWQQPWVQNLLPFLTSLSFHAAVLIIGLLAYGAYKAVTALPHQEQTIIPDSTMADEGPPGGIPNQGLGGDPLRQAMQDKDPTAGSKDGWANKKGPTVDITAEGGGSSDSDQASIIGAGFSAAAGRGSGIGLGNGNGNGGGNGDGSGPMAMFGAPGGGGIGPKGPVFGNGGNARQIVFVCDASGSMITKMASLKDQLSKAVIGLHPIQSFNVIFFQDKKCDALSKDGQLIPATPQAKRKAGDFLEGITTSGTTDPIPGIQLAFQSHPQLVYLLTDGDFPDNATVLKTIRDLNKDHKVKINTIAFTGESDKDTDFLDLLKTIAKENGGTFKHVNEGDL